MGAREGGARRVISSNALECPAELIVRRRVRFEDCGRAAEMIDRPCRIAVLEFLDPGRRPDARLLLELGALAETFSFGNVDSAGVLLAG